MLQIFFCHMVSVINNVSFLFSEVGSLFLLVFWGNVFPNMILFS